jgi:hypothetical protein
LNPSFDALKEKRDKKSEKRLTNAAPLENPKLSSFSTTIDDFEVKKIK